MQYEQERAIELGYNFTSLMNTSDKMFTRCLKKKEKGSVFK